jgi:hypothetical protein
LLEHVEVLAGRLLRGRHQIGGCRIGAGGSCQPIEVAKLPLEITDHSRQQRPQIDVVKPRE